jgi:hypothetical protein
LVHHAVERDVQQAVAGDADGDKLRVGGLVAQLQDAVDVAGSGESGEVELEADLEIR